jgi:hypothetical protein
LLDVKTQPLTDRTMKEAMRYAVVSRYLDLVESSRCATASPTPVTVPESAVSSLGVCQTGASDAHNAFEDDHLVRAASVSGDKSAIRTHITACPARAECAPGDDSEGSDAAARRVG